MRINLEQLRKQLEHAEADIRRLEQDLRALARATRIPAKRVIPNKKKAAKETHVIEEFFHD